MPPNTARVAAAVLNRIANSEHELTVHYPKKRVGPAGVSPVALPVSPLIAAPNPQKPVDADFDYEPVEEPVTMPCLFLSVTTMGEARKARLDPNSAGWSHDATALARVRRTDAERTDGRSVFVGASHVSVNGQRFKILAWSKMGNSMTEAATYQVMLGSGE
jgi:hypothetical protein